MFYNVVSYFDVWGNPEDGWEVNNSGVVYDNLLIPAEYSMKQILSLLCRMRFLAIDDLRKISVEEIGESLEISLRKGGMPLIGLWPVYSEGGEVCA